jgi:hypothetical protein
MPYGLEHGDTDFYAEVAKGAAGVDVSAGFDLVLITD